MPHDQHGTELAVGDTVMVPCRVKAIHLTEDYCNVDLETKIAMPPDYGHFVPLTLNSRQTIKPLPEAAARLPAPHGWQPIETAPKDGTALLVWADGSHICHIVWKNERWEWLGGGAYPPGQYELSHWLPLPSPPTAHGCPPEKETL